MKKSLGARTLAMPTPVWVIGSYDDKGKPNVMTASWAGICCSRPPCINVSLRKATYSYRCLVERQAFTVSIPSQQYVKEADFFGKVSGSNVDKFAASGLTPVPSELVDAPYVKEFPLVLECKIVQTHELGLHTLFVGEILDVKAERAVLDENELPVVERVAPLVFSPEIRAYHGLGKRFGRAFSIGKELES